MSFIPSVLAVISVLCGSLMYYNMRCSMDLKLLRANLMESNEIPIASPKDDHSLVENLESSVRIIAIESLSNLKEELNKLREKEHNLQSAFTENCYNIPIDDVQSQLSIDHINYADKILGAQIEQINAVPVKADCSSWFGRQFKGNPPENMLHSSMKPGCCYAFMNSTANVTISLAKTIFIEAIEIEHIPQYKSPTRETSSAPKRFKAYGINMSNSELYLGEFEFENKSPFQVFPVKSLSPCKKLRLEFLSNHGNPYFTCVYRIAVYGRPFD